MCLQRQSVFVFVVNKSEKSHPKPKTIAEDNFVSHRTHTHTHTRIPIAHKRIRTHTHKRPHTHTLTNNASTQDKFGTRGCFVSFLLQRLSSPGRPKQKKLSTHKQKKSQSGSSPLFVCEWLRRRRAVGFLGVEL